MTIKDLADLILKQTRERIARQHSQWQADAERVEIRSGAKYTKINRGPEGNMSGFLMIDNQTGEIFGIKGYGRVHKGHRYGTLETADRWFWGEYYPRKLATAGRHSEGPCPRCGQLTNAPGPCTACMTGSG